MGGKRRKEKKPPVLRTQEEREQEISVIKNKISIMGLTDDLGRISNLFEVMEEYIQNGKTLTGSIKLEGYNRVIDYVFPEKKNINLMLNIRYTN